MSKQKLYRVLIPMKTNSGETYQNERRVFEHTVLVPKAGGYTQWPGLHGVWQDVVTSKLFIDDMVAYDVACSPSRFQEILDQAFKIFSDQEAIAWSIIGDMTIARRA